MSTSTVIDLCEIIRPMTTRDEVLGRRVARELKHLRETYSDLHNLTVQEFAEHVGVTKKHLYQLENAKHSPTIDTLARICRTCDSSIVAFFYKIITHAELAEIQRESAEERKWIELLVMGLSNPATRRVVMDAATTVRELLAMFDVR